MPQTKQIQGIAKEKKSPDDKETSRPTGQITRLPNYIGSDYPRRKISKLHGPRQLAYGVIVVMKEE